MAETINCQIQTCNCKKENQNPKIKKSQLAFFIVYSLEKNDLPDRNHMSKVNDDKMQVIQQGFDSSQIILETVPFQTQMNFPCSSITGLVIIIINVVGFI